MRTKCFLIALVLAVFFLSILSAGPAAANTAHCGNVTSNETWAKSGNIHVVTCNVVVASGVTLTISEGTIVKFDIGRSLIVDGTLRVLGAPSSPVHFTSIHDDSIGGDTNGNGGATLPNWDNWRGLEFRDSSNDSASLIDNAVIRFAGRDYRGGVNLLKASPTLQYSTITDGFRGIITDTSTPNLICNNIYNNRGWGLENSTPSVVVDARNQWWGSSSGPRHSTNPTGTGNAVSDGVVFAPWLNSACVSSDAPGNLTAIAISRTQIDLNWRDNSTNESEFHIERSPNGGGNWTEIATTTANVTSYSNTGLTCGVTYFYRVRAHRHSDGQYTAYSNVAQTTTQACPPPNAPTNLSAVAVSRSQINLGWQDNSADESEFYLERSMNRASGWVEIGIVSTNITNYNDFGVFCGSTYYYRARAYRHNDSQYSDYSNVANTTTLPCFKAYLPIAVAPFVLLPRE